MNYKIYSLFLGIMMLALIPKASAQSQTHTITISQVFTNTSATTWTVPVGVTSVTVECYGGGGGGMQGKFKNDGGNIKIDGDNKPYGGGGGAYAASTFTVTAGATYYICAGAGGAAGGDGSASWFSTNNKVDNAIVSAAGGGKASKNGAGAGGTVANSKGDTRYDGGTGGSYTQSGSTFYSGAGGGAAGPNGAGGNAADYTAGTGNGGRAGNGGAGGNSGTAANGSEFGGGGSGGMGTATGTQYTGGAGAQGAVLVTYDINYTVQDYEAVQGSVVSLDLGIESINGCEIHWYDQNHNEITTASTYSYIKGAAENDIYYVRLYDGTTPLTDEMQITVHLVGSSAPEGYSSVVASQIFNSTSATTWTVPSGVTSVTVECYGGGGAGLAGKSGDANKTGNGGGAGAYASSTLTVEPGTTYYLCAGQGGNNGAGNASWFGTKNGNNNYTYIVSAAGGAVGAKTTGGAGGQATASTGTIRYSGGTGGTSQNGYSGAGGGAAGPNGNGHNANAAVGGTGNGGRAGNGANGVTNASGVVGNTYGGGGSGGMGSSEQTGGAGGNGVVSVTYEVIYHVQDYESESGEWVDMDLGIASNPGCEIHWYDSHNNLLDTRGFYSYVKTTAPCDTFYVQLYDGANPLTEKQRILVRRICPEAPDGYTAMPIGESCWLMSNVPGSQDSLFTYEEVTSMDQNGCPYGWYLPSKAELQAAFDGLQETFIYPGYYRGAISAREGKGILEFFWTRDNLDTNSASRNDIAYVTDDCGQVMESPRISDNDAYSIRCVQDPNINTHYHLYKFAVSETDSVYFSQGNLQYLASNDTWKFATEQYDYVGNAAGNTTPMPDRATQNNWIDLYGWGTSGWDNGNMYYRPYDIYINGSDDGCLDADDDGYGPVYCHCDTTINDKGKLVINCTEDHSNLDLTPNFTQWEGKTNGLEGVLTAEERAEYEKSDWGRYIGAEIINGGRTDWRTLTLAEWHFLMNQRDDAANKEAHATIGGENGVPGIIFLPEFWDWNNCPNIPHFQTTHKYADNVYTMAQWRRMEYYGAMFLPAAGHRNVGGEGSATDANGNVVYQAGVEGEYWASTAHPSSEGCAHPITFVNGSDIGTTATHTHDRAVGRAVRLVRNCDTDESGRLSNNQ